MSKEVKMSKTEKRIAKFMKELDDHGIGDSPYVSIREFAYFTQKVERRLTKLEVYHYIEWAWMTGLTLLILKLGGLW
jgi:hypothetical protein